MVTHPAAESASWPTSNCHGQLLPSDEINQTYPDAPNEAIGEDGWNHGSVLLDTIARMSWQAVSGNLIRRGKELNP
jgi:hypothetical protein